MKDLIENLGGGSLSAKDTSKLIRKKYKSITYESIKNAVSNCKPNKLHNIKANIKNYINAGKYSESVEIQIIVSIISIFIAISNGRFALIFVACYILFLFVNAIRKRFTDVYTVKCILLLEIVEDKIKSEDKKKSEEKINKMLEGNMTVKNLDCEVVEVIKTIENKARKETLTIKLNNKKAPVKNTSAEK